MGQGKGSAGSQGYSGPTGPNFQSMMSGGQAPSQTSQTPRAPIGEQDALSDTSGSVSSPRAQAIARSAGWGALAGGIPGPHSLVTAGIGAFQGGKSFDEKAAEAYGLTVKEYNEAIGQGKYDRETGFAPRDGSSLATDEDDFDALGSAGRFGST